MICPCLWKMPARAAISICNLALAVLTVLIYLQLIVFLIVWPFDERACRLTWQEVDQYGVLADVCRDAKVRRQMAMWDFADALARHDEREP